MRRRQSSYPPEEFDPLDWVPDKKREKRIRKPTLTSVAKQAARAGIEVAKYEVDPATGKIIVVPGKPANIPDANITADASEWN